jgi:hypothetical protein
MVPHPHECGTTSAPTTKVTGRKKPVKRLVVDEDASPVIFKLFTLYAEGNSQEHVADILRARGALHPTGDEWKQSEEEASRLRSSDAALEDERARPADAEAFLGELARRVRDCTREERRDILRRAVPRVTITPLDGRRRLILAAYRLAPPVKIANGPLRESP